MAKRKRLTPAKLDTATGAPEVKSAFPRYPLGVAPTRDGSVPRPPIADVAHDAAASAALTEVAQVLTEARDEGRLIQRLPLAAIDTDFLVRDRMVVADEEMQTLTESIRVRGQQTAIEVTALDDGRYGLISGWRRLTALRALSVENPALDTVLAIIRSHEDSAAAYLAMVEENEIRVGLSYYERARIVARAVDLGVYGRDRVALAALFHAASRPKRSKIGAFVRIVRALDDVLRFPTALTERTGLALAQALEADAGLSTDITAALTRTPAKTAEAEIAAISAAMRPRDRPAPRPKPQVETLANGITLTTDPRGRLIVEGAALANADLRAALAKWLSAQ